MVRWGWVEMRGEEERDVERDDEFDGWVDRADWTGAGTFTMLSSALVTRARLDDKKTDRLEVRSSLYQP